MPEFDERLRVPLWWWPAAAVVVGLLAMEVYTLAEEAIPGMPPGAATGIVAVLVSLAAAALLAAGRVRVQVVAGQLRVGGAGLPLSRVRGVQVLGPEEVRQVMGPQAHAAAKVVYRGWLPGAVLIDVGPMIVPAEESATVRPADADPAAPSGAEPAADTGAQSGSGRPADADPPYWLVGSRRPAELAGALLAGRLGRPVAAVVDEPAPAAVPPGAGEESGRPRPPAGG